MIPEPWPFAADATPGAQFAGARELCALLAPCAPETFLNDYWGVMPLHIRGTPEKFASLFDRERFDVAICRAAEGAHPTYHLGALRPSDEDEPLTLTSTETITPERVDAHLHAGITITANDIGAYDERLARVARAIKEQMQYPGQVRFNCFLSPDGSGADTHIDALVTTTLQIEGRKRWRFSARPAIAWPLSNAQIDHFGMPVWMSPWAGNAAWEHLEPPNES